MALKNLFTKLDDDAFESALDALVSEAGSLDNFCFTDRNRDCDDNGASPFDSKTCDGGSLS
jgi:hypothetical protein